MPTISFRVNVDPIPQPRPKARRIGPGVQIYTPNSGPIAAYKAAIVEAFSQVAPEGFAPPESPIELSIAFFFERPQSRMKEARHTCKPDLDNLAKGVMDALNEVAWKDDGQVQELSLHKGWSSTKLGGKSGRKLISDPSRIEVTIEYE